MNVFVTGCAGFIGSKVAELLLQQGHRIVGVDTLKDGYDPRLKQWRLARLKQYQGFTFRSFDITDPEGLKSLFRRGSFGAVINLAARAGIRQSVEQPVSFMDTNINGSLVLLELCREFGVTKFILSSSSSVYGPHNQPPYREDIADTSRPISPYGASKKAAEVLAHTYYYLYGLDVTVFRYFTVYGPAGRPDMSIFRFVRWIAEGEPVTVYGDGTQRRDFTFVDDIARGTVAGLRSVGYDVINLGNDWPVSVLDVITKIESLLGRKAKLDCLPSHPADVQASHADITKARDLLGWRPEVSLDEGLRRAVEWYLDVRSLASQIELV